MHFLVVTDCGVMTLSSIMAMIMKWFVKNGYDGDGADDSRCDGHFKCAALRNHLNTLYTLLIYFICLFFIKLWNTITVLKFTSKVLYQCSVQVKHKQKPMSQHFQPHTLLDGVL